MNQKLNVLLQSIASFALVIFLLGCAGAEVKLSRTVTNPDNTVTEDSVIIVIPQQDGGGGGGGDNGGGGSGTPEPDCPPAEQCIPESNISNLNATIQSKFSNALASESLYINVNTSDGSLYSNTAGPAVAKLVEGGSVVASINVSYVIINGNQIRPADFPLLENWYNAHKSESEEQTFKMSFSNLDLGVVSSSGQVVTETHTLYDGVNVVDTYGYSYVYSPSDGGSDNDTPGDDTIF